MINTELPSKHAAFDNHLFQFFNILCLSKVWLQLMQTYQELFKLIGSDTDIMMTAQHHYGLQKVSGIL